MEGSKKPAASEEVVQLILDELSADAGAKLDSRKFATAHKLSHAEEVVPALKRLEAASSILTELVSYNTFELTGEAKQYIELGSPEFRLWKLIPEEGIDLKVFKESATKEIGEESYNIGWTNAMKLKAVKFEKKASDAPVPKGVKKEIEGTVFKLNASFVDKARDDLVKANEVLQEVEDGAEAKLKASGVDVTYLKGRKLIAPTTVKYFVVTRGPSYATKLVVHSNELTAEMIASGAWKTAQFKPYNLNAVGKKPEGGALHPLLKVRSQFREILMEMGFQEMSTDRFVESSFWNFDSLFQPQQHPARDSHDTFFISDPATTKSIPQDYLERVKKTHQSGDYGSIGWRYDWSEEEARKNLLRTHTTAVSAKLLYDIAKNGYTKPGKYFSIDRVYRNETMDSTHLCEFHQIEGVIIDKNLTLGDLMGVIRAFYVKLGIPDVSFKPAYNPYTEPSMEIFGYHPQLGKLVELGNSGMFRPEMLRPMGLPDDVRVIAWGLGLERPTMILYEIDNIRDLAGHKVSISSIQNNPLCRLDKVNHDAQKKKQQQEESQ